MSRFMPTGFKVSLGVLAILSSNVAAEQTDGQLKSVLVPNQDLRSIVDPNRPDAPEPKAKDKTEISVDAELDAHAELHERAELDAQRPPVPRIPWLQPIPDTPRPDGRKVVTKKPALVRSVSNDPLFDLGIVVSGSQTRVRGVFSGSPAQRAGIQAGDTLSRINGQRVPTKGDLERLLASELRTSERLSVDVIRNRRRQTVTVALPPLSTTEPAESVARTTRPNRVPARRVSTDSQATSPSETASRSQAESANAPGTRTARPAQPRARSTRSQRRPLIGDGGRLLGNGRLINSARRMLRLD